MTRFSDGVCRQEVGLVIPLIVRVSCVSSTKWPVLTVNVKSPCSPHTVGIGRELEVLVYILVRVDKVRENAAYALKEIAGPGMRGMYPVAEAVVELAFLPWR